MAQIDPSARCIHARLIYLGPRGAGKTTNLVRLHRLAAPGQDSLPSDAFQVNLGSLLGWRVRLSLRAVDGADGDGGRWLPADGFVFVADSAAARVAEGVEMIERLRRECTAAGIDAETLPLVFQFNKRDLADAALPAALETAVNWRHAPRFLATASAGRGVVETFEEAVVQVATSVLQSIASQTEAVASAAEIRAAVHTILAPLRERRTAPATPILAPPTATAAALPVATAPAPAGDDPSGLTRSVTEETARLLELAATAGSPGAPGAPPLPGLDPARLGRTIAEAARTRDAASVARVFLELASETSKLTGGSVLLLTPGDGPLAEAARLGLDVDPLNAPLTSTGAPISRRLALAARPLHGEELRRSAYGSNILRADLPYPESAVPLIASGRRLGLLVLYSDGHRPIDRQIQLAVEVVGWALSLVLAREHERGPAAGDGARACPPPGVQVSTPVP